MNLVDMMDFSRMDFDKFISLNAKKKVKYDLIWNINNLVQLKDISIILKGTSITKEKTISGDIPVIAGGKEIAYYHNQSNRDGNIITVSASGANAGFINYFKNPIFASDCNTIKSKDENIISTKLIFMFLNYLQSYIYFLQRGQAQPHVYKDDLEIVKIPLPPKDIQKKIINEIEDLEVFEKDSKDKIEKLNDEIRDYINQSLGKEKTLYEICDMKAGKFVSASDIEDIKTLKNYPCYGGNGLRGYTKTFTHEGIFSLIGRQGALCGNVHRVNGQFHATEHALVVTPFENIDTNWLYHKLKEMNLNQYATGVAQPGLSVKNLNDISVLVPSLQEQQQIVKQIESIENEIESIENELKTIPTKKEEILKKYL
jgi:type I restriction enzyme M protein